MPYQLFCKSVRGASHVKRDIPCEDYGLKYENSEIGCKIFVLGDGHGDPNCVRSQIGSRAVCEIASEELRVFAEFLNESKKNSEKNECAESDGWIYSSAPNLVDTLLNPDTAHELIYQLVRSIVGKWGLYVTEHFENNPFTEEEKEIASEMIDSYQRGEHTEHIYGTTMIAGLMTEDYLLVLHQGDGRCVVFDSNGVASQPVPWDVRCVGNMTTSMCEYDALESCRYHVIDIKKNPVIACVIGSDGVEDSFTSMDRMHIFYREQLAIACEEGMGIEELETYWESSLPTFSAKGSQDDVTICGVMDIEAFRDKLELMDVENDILSLKEAIEAIDKRLPKMQMKEDFLFNQKKDGAMAYNALEDKKRNLAKEYEEIRRDLQEMQRNDMQQQGGFFQSAQSFMQRIRLSMTSQKCLEYRLETIRKEIADIDGELLRAESEQNERIKEYEDYKKEREQLQEIRLYKAEKLKACQDEYDALTHPASAPIPTNSEPKKEEPAIEPQPHFITVNTEIEQVVQNQNEWNGSAQKTEILPNEEPITPAENDETAMDGADVIRAEENVLEDQTESMEKKSEEISAEPIIEEPISDSSETETQTTAEPTAAVSEPIAEDKIEIIEE